MVKSGIRPAQCRKPAAAIAARKLGPSVAVACNPQAVAISDGNKGPRSLVCFPQKYPHSTENRASHSQRRSAGPCYHLKSSLPSLDKPTPPDWLQIEGAEQKSRHTPIVSHFFSRLCSESLNFDKTFQFRQALGPDISLVFGRLYPFFTGEG